MYLTQEHLPIVAQCADMRRVGSDSLVQDSLGNATLVAARKGGGNGGKNLKHQPQIYDTKSGWNRLVGGCLLAKGEIERAAPLVRANKKM
jgi:hypothetical protein